MKPFHFHAARTPAPHTKTSAAVKAAILVAGICAAGACQAQSYQFIGLGSGQAGSLNDLGQVVWQSSVGASLWSGGSSTRLGAGDTSNVAAAINNAGEVVGAQFNQSGPGNDQSYATLWGGSNTVALNAPPVGGIVNNANSYARGINNAGEIVGNSQINAVLWGRGGSNPSILTVASSENAVANAINSRGEVVGSAEIGSGIAPYVPVKWINGNATVLPTLGGNFSSANAINDSGVIVGESATAAGGNTFYATKWNGSTLTKLGSLGGYSSDALAINNAGLIVGYSDTASSRSLATIWIGGKPVNLNNYLNPSVAQAGWVLDSATGINNQGWITGDAYNTKTGASDAFLLEVSPVPEADTWAMLAAGLGLLAVRAGRKPAFKPRTAANA